MADTLIEALTAPFEPEKYKDNYQAALKKLIKAKLKGVELEETKPSEKTEALDLMDALRASIDNLSKSHKQETSSSTRSKTKKPGAAVKPATKAKGRKKTA